MTSKEAKCSISAEGGILQRERTTRRPSGGSCEQQQEQ